MKYEYDMVIKEGMYRITITDTPDEIRVDLDDKILFRQWKEKNDL